jgi:hypothetical protein
MLDNIEGVERYTEGLADFDAFVADTMRRDAIERCFSRISEAAVKLDALAEQLAPAIPWHGQYPAPCLRRGRCQRLVECHQERATAVEARLPKRAVETRRTGRVIAP